LISTKLSRLVISVFLVFMFVSNVSAITYTSNYSLGLPARGEVWLTPWNTNFTTIDTILGQAAKVYEMTGTFNGPTGRVITLPVAVDAVSDYTIAITPNPKATGAVGDVSVVQGLTTFTVYCSQANTTDTFEASVIYVGTAGAFTDPAAQVCLVTTEAEMVSSDASTTTCDEWWLAGSFTLTAARIITKPMYPLKGNKITTTPTNTLTFAAGSHFPPEVDWPVFVSLPREVTFADQVTIHPNVFAADDGFDGTEDDANAWQCVLDAFPATGGKVVHDGVSVVASDLIWPNNGTYGYPILVEGNITEAQTGTYNTITGGGGGQIKYTGTGTLFDLRNGDASNITWLGSLKNLRLSGPYTFTAATPNVETNETTIGIDAYRLTNSQIDNVAVIAFGTGINVAHYMYYAILNNLTVNNNKYGIVTAGAWNGTTLSNSKVSTNRVAGIYSTYFGDTMKFDNCWIELNGQYANQYTSPLVGRGVYAGYGHQVIFEGGYLENNGDVNNTTPHQIYVNGDGFYRTAVAFNNIHSSYTYRRYLARLNGASSLSVSGGKLFSYKQATADADWVADTAYLENDYASPTTGNNLRYRCSVAGTSHADTEPVWPTNIGDTIVDNGATWICEEGSPGYVFKFDTTPTNIHVMGHEMPKFDTSQDDVSGSIHLATQSLLSRAVYQDSLHPGITIDRSGQGAQYLAVIPAGHIFLNDQYDKLNSGGSVGWQAIEPGAGAYADLNGMEPGDVQPDAGENYPTGSITIGTRTLTVVAYDSTGAAYTDSSHKTGLMIGAAIQIDTDGAISNGAFVPAEFSDGTDYAVIKEIVSIGTGNCVVRLDKPLKSATVTAGLMRYNACERSYFGVRQWYKSTSDTSTSGTGEDTLKSAPTFTAAMLRVDSTIPILLQGTITGTAGAHTIKLYLGATAFTLLSGTTTAGTWRFKGEIQITGAATQKLSGIFWNADGAAFIETAATEALSGALALYVTGECAEAADTITQNRMVVDLE